MNMQQVESTQIHAIGYSPETKTLAIQFKSKTGPGSTYHYAGVPPEEHAALIGADSIGKQFGASIKGRYQFKKQDEQQATS